MLQALLNMYVRCCASSIQSHKCIIYYYFFSHISLKIPNIYLTCNIACLWFWSKFCADLVSMF